MVVVTDVCLWLRQTVVDLIWLWIKTGDKCVDSMFWMKYVSTDVFNHRCSKLNVKRHWGKSGHWLNILLQNTASLKKGKRVMCFSDLMSSPVKNKQKQKKPLLMIQQLLARAPFLFEGVDPFCEWKPFSNQSKLHQSATYPPGRVQYG